jgi:chemoreceptor zinc-binding protein
MPNIDALTKAIAAHASWKARLRSSINTGKSDVSVETVRTDNHCEFGKFLYGPELSAAEKQSEHYRTIKPLHAQFHQEAAKVLELALSGQKEAAEQALGMGGSCAKIATTLTQAIMKWRDGAH